MVISFTMIILIFITLDKITLVFIKEYELVKKVLGLSKLDKYGIKLSNKRRYTRLWGTHALECSES